MNHRKYLSEIGKLGGAKRKLHPARRELAKAAALKRWTQNKTSIKIAPPDSIKTMPSG